MRHGRLLVHVGYPKTGTTSLQRALSLERAALLSQGILYPTATTALPEFGHHNIYWEAAGDERYDPGNGGLDDLLDEVRSIAPQDVVISSEALISLLLDFPERLGTLLEGLSQYRPTIVVGVRRLDEYVESLFRHQFNAWVWDRPIRRSTDIAGYVGDFDVPRAMAPVQLLLESRLDVVYLPFGPGMVERVSRAVGFDRRLTRRLTAHGDSNTTWIGNRGIALIRHLAQRPDEEQLRRRVAAERQAFRRLVESLGPPDGVRLMTPDRAQALVAEATPIYRAVGRRFARAVLGGGIPAAWRLGSTTTEFTADEVGRIEAFFAAPVMNGFG